RLQDPVENLANLAAELAVVLGGWSLGDHRAGVYDRNHARRREADTEQTALALRQHLKADRGLVDPRLELLQLAQRRPLRLADGLAARLDLQSLGHQVTC